MNDSQEFIIEMIPQGNFVKVSAIDVASGREVSVVGASSANQNDLHTLAINKLKYVMKKERDAAKSAADNSHRSRGFKV